MVELDGLNSVGAASAAALSEAMLDSEALMETLVCWYLQAATVAGRKVRPIRCTSLVANFLATTLEAAMRLPSSCAASVHIWEAKGSSCLRWPVLKIAARAYVTPEANRGVLT